VIVFDVQHHLPARVLTLDHPLARLIRGVEASIRERAPGTLLPGEEQALADWLVHRYRLFEAVVLDAEELGRIPPPVVVIRRDEVEVYRATCEGLG
jgi:hypothetical protein